MNNSFGGPEEIPLNQAVELVASNGIERVEVSGDDIKLFTADGQEYESRKESGNI